MTSGRVPTWFSVSIVVVSLVYTTADLAAAETPNPQPRIDAHQSSTAASAAIKRTAEKTDQKEGTARDPDTMAWHSIDGGGGSSSGGSLSLTVAIGQPETGLSALGTETLVGGLWALSHTSHLFSDSFDSGGTLVWSTTVP